MLSFYPRAAHFPGDGFPSASDILHLNHVSILPTADNMARNRVQVQRSLPALQCQSCNVETQINGLLDFILGSDLLTPIPSAVDYDALVVRMDARSSAPAAPPLSTRFPDCPDLSWKRPSRRSCSQITDAMLSTAPPVPLSTPSSAVTPGPTHIMGSPSVMALAAQTSAGQVPQHAVDPAANLSLPVPQVLALPYMSTMALIDGKEVLSLRHLSNQTLTRAKKSFVRLPVILEDMATR